MRKKSISDECLAIASAKNLRLKLNKCKSELDMVVSDRKNSLSKEKISHNSNLNKKMKKKFKNFTKLLFNGSSTKKLNDKENISKCDNLVNLRKQSEDIINYNHVNRHKDSVFYTTSTTTTLMTQQDFSNMILNANERLDSVKIEMMNNINKLIERENGLNDLETKANNLSLNTIDLNQTSNNVKKSLKIDYYKKFIYIVLFLLALVFFSICIIVYINNYVIINNSVSKNQNDLANINKNLYKTSKRNLFGKVFYFLNK